MKIFLGLSEIAGFFSRLKVGLEALGHDVDFIDVAQHPFSYGGSSPPPEALNKIFVCESRRSGLRHRILMKKNSSNLFFLSPTFWLYRCLYGLLKIRNIYSFIRYFKQYDAVIFIFGNSFSVRCNLVQFNDLFWLKLIGIKIIFLMCGSDSRPAFVDGAILSVLPEVNAETIVNTTCITEQNNKQIEKYADFIISNVFSSYFFSKPVIAIQAIGHASITDNDVIELSNDRDNTSKIRILHAPSSKDVKGTAIIQAVITELLSDGYAFEFNVLSGVSNKQVIEEIKHCDFVIDQLFSDYAMAGFATEAARYGKPAIVGSYIDINEYHRASQVLGMPPCHFCHPDDIKQAIVKLIEDTKYRLKLGREAADYVRTKLDPQRVAQRYIDLIENNYPQTWKMDARSFITALPMGMTRDAMVNVMNIVANQIENLSPLMQKLLKEQLTIGPGE